MGNWARRGGRDGPEPQREERDCHMLLDKCAWRMLSHEGGRLRCGVGATFLEGSET